jgi:hypothetical protein
VVYWLSCLSLDPRFAASNPAEDDAFLSEIKIRSTISFGEEVKPAVPCRKILRHVKNPYSVRYLQVFTDTSRQVSHALLLDVCWSLPEHYTDTFS